MFDSFTLERVDVGDAVLRVRHGGAGPAVLLLHGHPRTHTTWHRVAPLLAGSHTVVCPDLRGFGQSSQPADSPDHAGSSKPDKPERAILHDPDAWYGERNSAAHMGAENYADYRAAIHDPRTVHGMIEDYRACLGVDRAHDEEDRRRGRTVQCP